MMNINRVRFASLEPMAKIQTPIRTRMECGKKHLKPTLIPNPTVSFRLEKKEKEKSIEFHVKVRRLLVSM